jgi:hypothetical protein
LIQMAPIRKVITNDASQFAEEDVYPEQCNFVSDDLGTANQFIQGLLDAVNHLPMPAAMLAGSLRFQLSRSLYHAEALASELIQLVASFRPICRSGTRLTATKKKEIQLKLQELAQSIDDSSRIFGQLTDTIQSKEGIIDPDVQPPQSVPVPIPSPVAPVSPAAPMPDPPVLSDSLTRLGEIMFKKYDSDEFKVLCKYMGTDYDNLRPGNLKLKMLYLIEYCDRRRGQYVRLIQQMLKDFPDLQGQL